MATSELNVPHAGQFEEELIATVVASDAGYRLAASRLGPLDFYRPLHGQIFQACRELSDLSGVDEDSLDERLQRVAQMVDVDEDWLRVIVEARMLQWDRRGTLARRVKEASQTRALMRVCAIVHNRIGAGDKLSDVLAELAPVRPLLVGAS